MIKYFIDYESHSDLILRGYFGLLNDSFKERDEQFKVFISLMQGGHFREGDSLSELVEFLGSGLPNDSRCSMKRHVETSKTLDRERALKMAQFEKTAHLRSSLLVCGPVTVEVLMLIVPNGVQMRDGREDGLLGQTHKSRSLRIFSLSNLKSFSRRKNFRNLRGNEGTQMKEKIVNTTIKLDSRSSLCLLLRFIRSWGGEHLWLLFF